MSWQERVREFCRQEVIYQKVPDVEQGTLRMMNAWAYALMWSLMDYDISHALITQLYHLVDPDVNHPHKYRQFEVVVNGREAVLSGLVQFEMTELIFRINSTVHPMHPDELFYRFEKIHAGTDGNGRVGQILYNMQMGTLIEPIWAPEFAVLEKQYEE